MEMSLIVNGWTHEGMNEVQEAFYPGWWRWHLAGLVAKCVLRLFQNINDGELSLHFNYCHVSVIIIILHLEL